MKSIVSVVVGLCLFYISFAERMTQLRLGCPSTEKPLTTKRRRKRTRIEKKKKGKRTRLVQEASLPWFSSSHNEMVFHQCLVNSESFSSSHSLPLILSLSRSLTPSLSVSLTLSYSLRLSLVLSLSLFLNSLSLSQLSSSYIFLSLPPSASPYSH